MGEYSFPQKEKLKSRKSIDRLFESGKSVSHYPLRMLWCEEIHPDNAFIKAGFSVPKKNFKRAVDRNLLKRRMREAYRLNKALASTFEKDSPSGYSVFFIYSSEDLIDYQTIEDALKKCLNKIN